MSLTVPRRAEEFRGVFEFLDKNGDGALTKDEIRYIMNGMGHDLSDDEIRDLISDIGGPGATMVDEAHFLNFVAQQLQGDPAEELRECWKITSNQTKQTVKGEPKEQPGINWKDVEGLMKKLGEDLPEEEAEEMILQADKKGHGQLGYEEFLNLLIVPPGGD
jgi:calmodulin